MNREIGERWVQALRSGEYPQVTGALHRDDGYCCLGVLCEIAVADGVIISQYSEDDHRWFYGPAEHLHDSSLLPEVVKTWAGLDHINPDFNEPPSDALHAGVVRSLTELNDGYDKIGPDGTLVRTPSASFAEIADVIERYFINT